MRRLIAAVSLAVVALGPNPARASVDARQSFAAPRASAPAPGDGLWQNAIVAGEFVDVTTRRPAPEETRAYLTFDAQHAYVRIDCEQPPATVRAGQSTNDLGFGLDDYAGVALDTSGNGAQVYFFEITPRGVRYQQASESARYFPRWSASAARGERGWSAYFTIPLNVLRTQSAPVQTWRFNFVRHLGAVNENYSWAYDPLMTDNGNWPNFSDARFWPELRAVQVDQRAVRPPGHADLYGLGTLGADRRAFDYGTSGVYRPASVPTAGADGEVFLRNTIALVGTIHPDFSNAEIDQETIAPQEFDRALTEYRPFFAQGASFFTPKAYALALTGAANTVWYSPAIADFERGIKLEGTSGLQSFGLLNVTGPGLDDTAFGYAHVLSDQSFQYWSDGVLARHPGDHDTTLEGGARLRDLRSGVSAGFDLALEQSDAAAVRSAAHSLELVTNVDQPNYRLYAAYTDITPGYGPLDGYTRVADLRGPFAFGELRGSGTHGVKSYDVQVGADRYLDRSGAVHLAESYADAAVTFTDGLRLEFNPYNSELRTYPSPSGYAGGSTARYAVDTLSAGYGDGTDAPTDLSYAWGPFGTGYVQQFFTSGARRLGRRLTLALEYDGTRERPYAGPADGQYLRKIALGASLSATTNVSLALRTISGSGGYASPGANLSASYHYHGLAGNEFFLQFGTPAAAATLDRVLLKYVVHLGGGSGS